MDIVVLAIALIAALLLPRGRALPVAAVAWLAGLLMVAVGPAHNDDVHVGSAGFWVPWAVVLVLALGLVFGVTALRRRRGDAAAAL
jgi:Na+/H+ antiporter NhaD/arsenite permease-like protein